MKKDGEEEEEEKEKEKSLWNKGWIRYYVFNLSIKSIIDLCKMNGVILLPRDVQDLFRLFSSLGIIRGTSTKYFNKSKENTLETLRKHFNIEW